SCLPRARGAGRDRRLSVRKTTHVARSCIVSGLSCMRGSTHRRIASVFVLAVTKTTTRLDLRLIYLFYPAKYFAVRDRAPGPNTLAAALLPSSFRNKDFTSFFSRSDTSAWLIAVIPFSIVSNITCCCRGG